MNAQSDLGFWRTAALDAKLLLVGIPVLIWTAFPIYHMVLFSISTQESALSGALFPAKPTFANFTRVFKQQHHYLEHFWIQMLNSLVIAVATGVITLLVATFAAFAISRLKVRGGQTVMNLALFTYFIPAAFNTWDRTSPSAQYNTAFRVWSNGLQNS